MCKRYLSTANNIIRDRKWIQSILPVCKTVENAQLEVKWIKEELAEHSWEEAIRRRSEHVPLQYIIGSQPFGNLDIKCREDVLIPRWETEEWTTKLINKVKNVPNLRILDMCTGTGCIPLLMGNRIPSSQVKGMDVSDHALRLSNENNETIGSKNVEFEYGDVFDENVLKNANYDLITSNPPYISQEDYINGDTEKSVARYEPKLALVGGVEFYKALIENVVLPSNADGFFFEVGYLEQAKYTQKLLSDRWSSNVYKDGADKIRCVYAWKKDSKMQVLESI